MKYSGIGGQAVIEGIMMKNKQNYSVAVRKPDGNIEVTKSEYVSATEKIPFLALPFIRGIFAFVDSMMLGMKALSFSASFFEDDEDSKPSKSELFFRKIFGEKLEKVVMGIAMFFSFLFAIGIFMVLPMLISNILRGFTDNYYIIAVFEGVLRLAIFILYILLISGMDEIKRTFMYHGAEHKCISCIENGLPLTVENVMKSSKEHKRCGTSFIIIVMMISIVFFMIFRVDTVWLRALSRILLVPVIAGISYEFLRLAGRSNSCVVNILSRPGMWMQALTTKEPTDDMVEVAIRAVEEVFDWESYIKENFSRS